MEAWMEQVQTTMARRVAACANQDHVQIIKHANDICYTKEVRSDRQGTPFSPWTTGNDDAIGHLKGDVTSIAGIH